MVLGPSMAASQKGFGDSGGRVGSCTRGTTSCKRVASWLVIVTGRTEDFGGGGSGTGVAGVLSG